MKTVSLGDLTLYDYQPRLDTLSDEVIEGLSKKQKTLPSKFFYDERGSKLFDDICRLPEYYPTRTEMSIFRNNITDIAEHIGPEALIVEFGSGTGAKTHFLLDNLISPAAYMPIEIDRSILEFSARQLRTEYPDLEIIPICADFHDHIKLPRTEKQARRTVAFFPGSTLGNFRWDEAMQFLRTVALMADVGGGMLLGIDLMKDRDVLRAAYDDAQGTTAEFNLNILVRINRELDADFDLGSFVHRAVYNEEEGRIEMHLVSTRPQDVTIGEHTFHFKKGEHIVSEYSHKYDLDRFSEILAENGFSVKEVWTDKNTYFGVLYLEVLPNVHELLADTEKMFHVHPDSVK